MIKRKRVQKRKRREKIKTNNKIEIKKLWKEQARQIKPQLNFVESGYTFKPWVLEGNQHMNAILWKKKADREKRGDESTIVGKDGEVSEMRNARERKTDSRGQENARA